MKQLNTFINESLINEVFFKSADYEKHDFKYPLIIMSKIVNGDPIKLGKDGKGGEWVCKDIELAKKLFEDPVKIDTVEKFNDVMVKLNGPSWTRIFKGQASGYVDGVIKNAGSKFERDYLDYLNTNPEAIEKINEITGENWVGSEATLVASDNVKRPLRFDKGIYLSTISGYNTIGDAVADIKLHRGDDVLNLSLKNTKSTTFINTGIKKLFPLSIFKQYKETNEIQISKETKLLLDLVGIDAKRFLEVFIKYDNHTTSDNVDYIIDNTTLIKGNKLFKTFMDSVIGYNYILVHKIGKEIHYYDLRKQENTDKFIGKVISSKIYYGGRQGKGKRVDVVIETTWLKLNINFRSKDGTIYPTHIMCNYIIK
jgi:hypothetical protein